MEPKVIAAVKINIKFGLDDKLFLIYHHFQINGLLKNNLKNLVLLLLEDEND